LRWFDIVLMPAHSRPP